jgi:hypothetical protein
VLDRGALQENAYRRSPVQIEASEHRPAAERVAPGGPSPRPRIEGARSASYPRVRRPQPSFV